MTSVTATGFRANIKHYMDLVIKDSQEVIINRGNEAAVPIPMNQYNARQEPEHLMSSTEMEKAILTGMEDVKKAMEPLFTTRPELDRSGMGFSFMEAFMDQVEVSSKPGKGTIVKMQKTIGKGRKVWTTQSL